MRKSKLIDLRRRVAATTAARRFFNAFLGSSDNFWLSPRELSVQEVTKIISIEEGVDPEQAYDALFETGMGLIEESPEVDYWIRGLPI